MAHRADANASYWLPATPAADPTVCMAITWKTPAAGPTVCVAITWKTPAIGPVVCVAIEPEKILYNQRTKKLVLVLEDSVGACQKG